MVLVLFVMVRAVLFVNHNIIAESNPWFLLNDNSSLFDGAVASTRSLLAAAAVVVVAIGRWVEKGRGRRRLDFVHHVVTVATVCSLLILLASIDDVKRKRETLVIESSI